MYCSPGSPSTSHFPIGKPHIPSNVIVNVLRSRYQSEPAFVQLLLPPFVSPEKI